MKMLIAVSLGYRGSFRVHDMLWPTDYFYANLARKCPPPDCGERRQPGQIGDRETSDDLGCQQWVHQPVDTRFVCLTGGFERLGSVFTYYVYVECMEC